MPNDSVSIVMKLTDDVSGKMKTIASTAQGCSKQFEELQRKAQQLGQRYADLNKRSAEASAEALDIKKRMDEAAKSFKQTGDEADKVRFESLKEQYNALTDAAKGYAAEAKNTIKDINAISEEARKLEGGPTASGGFLITIFGDDLGGKLAQSGVFKMLGDTAADSVGALAESALGQPLATLGSSIASGIASGAAAGAMAGIPAIGAVVGGVTGAVSGLTQIGQQRDDAFKDYYANLYDTVNANTAESLTSGKTLAAGRETTKLSFDTLLGSKEESAAFLADVLETANTTPFLYGDLVGISKTLLSFNYAVEDIIPTLTKVGDAGAALGLSTSDIGTVATYLGRMKSSGKATLEYLNPLSERGFSVFQWIADDLGVSIAEVYDKISKSDLPGTYVSDLILGKFEALYGGMMEVQAGSTEGLDSTLQGLLENIDAAGGAAYNDLRNRGKEADIAAYGGTLGSVMETMAAMAGENQAYLDNLSEQYTREALSAVLLGEKTTVFSGEDSQKLEEMRAQFREASARYEETGSREAALEMVNLQESAEALATAAYESSEWYQKLQDTELDQIAAIRENTAGLAAATNALAVSNEKTKGVASTWKHGFATYEDAVTATGGDAGVLEALGWYDGSHAFGLKRVPYDGYRALLHQGEEVLTAEEAREQDNGAGGVQIVITGNEFQVRQDSDIDGIAQALARELRKAGLRAG